MKQFAYIFAGNLVLGVAIFFSQPIADLVVRENFAFLEKIMARLVICLLHRVSSTAEVL